MLLMRTLLETVYFFHKSFLCIGNFPTFLKGRTGERTYLVTWPKNFVFGQVLFSTACICLSVCVSEAFITQKVLDRFWWNLAGWRIMIKARFLLKMKLIALIERIPGPKEWRISIYLKIFSVESFEISLYNALYNSIDNL